MARSAEEALAAASGAAGLELEFQHARKRRRATEPRYDMEAPEGRFAEATWAAAVRKLWAEDFTSTAEGIIV